MVTYSPTDVGQLQGADANAEREDWPRDKLLVRASLAILSGISFVEVMSLVTVLNDTPRTTSKMTPSPSSATAPKDTGKV